MSKITRFPMLSMAVMMAVMMLIGCIREPELHLHRGGSGEFSLPIIDLELDIYWDYDTEYGINYNWREEWYYGWDETDKSIFGELGYVEPNAFNLRRYHTYFVPGAPHTKVLRNYVEGRHFVAEYEWGYWDILAWNDINTIDGVQSLRFDEETSLDYVTASTGQTMYPSRYHAPRYTRSFYQPELLFAGYDEAEKITEDLEGFVYDPDTKVWRKRLRMVLEPVTYIYLTQVIIHHNRGRISGCDGMANLSGMAQSVVLNTGIAGSDPIAVHYNSRLKNHCDMKGEDVDIVGGRLVTFGMCSINPNRVGRGTRAIDDGNHHYMDVNLQFNTGVDSTFVFDVTDQVRKRYKGGVLTVELDMDTIPVPSRSGGSGFDATVVNPDSVTYEFDMSRRPRRTTPTIARPAARLKKQKIKIHDNSRSIHDNSRSIHGNSR